MLHNFPLPQLSLQSNYAFTTKRKEKFRQDCLNLVKVLRQTFQLSDLTNMALLTALICVSAYIVIPLPFSPVLLTAQTLVIHLTALILPPRQAVFTILVYLLLGIIGLPVFSGGMGGPGKLFGPTGGYLLSWLVSVPAVSAMKGKKYSFFRYSLVTIMIGTPIIYFLGSLYMKLLAHMTWEAAFTVSVLPFIPLDLLKCAAASAIAGPLHATLRLTGTNSPVN